MRSRSLPRTRDNHGIDSIELLLDKGELREDGMGDIDEPSYYGKHNYYYDESKGFKVDSHLSLRPNRVRKMVSRGLLMAALTLTALLARRHARSCSITPHTPEWPVSTSAPPAWTGGLTKDQFVRAVLRAPVEGLPDIAAIRQKCEHDVKWQPGLVWHCAPVNPGLVNALVSLLGCLRYALEAGATTIVFPGVTRRTSDLKKLSWEDDTDEDWSDPPSIFFDVPYFTELWGKACPEMHTIVFRPRIKDLPGGKDSIPIEPARIAPFEFDGRIPLDASAWRPAFDTWMVDHTHTTMRPEKPLRLYQKKVIVEFNVHADRQPFVRTFARSVRFTMQARRLAASALWELGRIVGHPLAPVAASATNDAVVHNTSEGPQVPHVNDLQTGRLTKPGFMGVHLRTEPDVPHQWMPHKAQAAAYLNEARKLGMRFVLVATGSTEELEKFRAFAAEGFPDHDTKVLSKYDLLTPEDLAELRSMTFDQQAMVDFELLMRSEFFCGVTHSSFAWEVALRRALLPEAGSFSPTTSEDFRDGLSVLVGKYTPNPMPKGLWP